MSDRLPNAYRRAEDLLELLIDAGPLSSADVCDRLGWTKGQFAGALKVARETLCDQYGVTIPHPTPEAGWRYEVTTEWQPIEAGAVYALGHAEARLRSIHRDIVLVKPALDPQSKEGRRANFLDKHLSHILGTLAEISNG